MDPFSSQVKQVTCWGSGTQSPDLSHQPKGWFLGVGVLFLQALNFPPWLTPRKRSLPQPPLLCNPAPTPSSAGYLLSLFVVSLFLLMIGSSAFSNWWLGLWLDMGSQVSSPWHQEILSQFPMESLNVPNTMGGASHRPPQG